MWLLITTTRHGARWIAYASREAAITHAREHVGTHYPADACSSEATVFDGPTRFTISRSTSFGERKAQVQALPFVDE